MNVASRFVSRNLRASGKMIIKRVVSLVVFHPWNWSNVCHSSKPRACDTDATVCVSFPPRSESENYRARTDFDSSFRESLRSRNGMNRSIASSFFFFFFSGL